MTIVFLAITSALVLMLPLRLPLPVRLAMAGTDIIAALIVFVAWRQQRTDRSFGSKPAHQPATASYHFVPKDTKR